MQKINRFNFDLVAVGHDAKARVLSGLLWFVFCATFLLASALVHAADWRLSRQLTVKGVYSDNLDLENSTGDSSTQDGFFTELTPGFVLNGSGRRLDLKMAYSLQALHYLSHSSEDRINHRLEARSNSELYQDHLFLDLSMGARQEMIDSLGASSWDATDSSSNLQTSYTYLISPSFKNRFGRLAEMTMRFEQDGVFYSDEGQDSLGYRTHFDLISGPILGDLQLGLIADQESLMYQDGPDDQFSKVIVVAGYQFDNRWRFDVFGGYENNDYSALETTDGLFWETELTWNPNRRVIAKAGIGERYFGWTPRFELEYRRKHSIWSLSYQRDISNARTDRRRSSVYSFEDAFGESLTPDTGDNSSVSTNNAAASSSVYVSDRLETAINFKTRRSSLGVSLNYDLRSYEDSMRDEEALEVRASWSRRLATRTSLNLGGGWRHVDRDDHSDNESNTLNREEYYLETGLTRQLSQRTFIDCDYAFRDDSESGSENRLTLALRVSWQ